MIFSCNCLNVKFYVLEHKCSVDDTISSIVAEDENLCPLQLDIGGISIVNIPLFLLYKYL